MFIKMINKALEVLIGFFYRHPWGIVPAFMLHAVVLFAIGSGADYATGAVSTVLGVTGFALYVFGMLFIAFAGIEAYYDRKRDNC